MYVDPEVIEAGARLLQGAVDNGFPVAEEIEWARLDEEQGEALKAILDGIEFGDLCDALRAVAARLPEPDEASND